MYCVYYSYYKRIEDFPNRGKYTNNVEKIIPVYYTLHKITNFETTTLVKTRISTGINILRILIDIR